jgi:hypothetical protein
MEQLVILLVIGAISLINWLLQKSAEHKKRQRLERKPDGPDAPGAGSPASPWSADDPQTDVHGKSPRDGHSEKSVPEPEEQMRRFMEALGLPVPDDRSHEPEVTLPFQPEPERPAAPPPLPVAKPQPPRQAPAKTTLRQNRETRELAQQFERSALDAASDTGSVAAFRELLQNPITARQGIILREILGPPKALES